MSPAERPCGCDLRWPCQCAPEGITVRGTFERGCRACELSWEGRRHEVIGDWWSHIRSPEHDATYAARKEQLDAEDAERARQIDGALW